MEDLLKILGQIWRFLLREPVVLIVVIAWVGGGLVRVLKWFTDQAARRKKAEETSPSEALEPAEANPGNIAREIQRQVEATNQNTARLEKEAKRRAEKMASPGPRESAARKPARLRAPETAAQQETREVLREAMIESVRTKQLDARKSIQVGVDGGTAFAAQARRVRAAFQMGDLRQAILTSEILQPPLSLRDP